MLHSSPTKTSGYLRGALCFVIWAAPLLPLLPQAMLSDVGLLRALQEYKKDPRTATFAARLRALAGRKGQFSRFPFEAGNSPTWTPKVCIRMAILGGFGLKVWCPGTQCYRAVSLKESILRIVRQDSGWA